MPAPSASHSHIWFDGEDGVEDVEDDAPSLVPSAFGAADCPPPDDEDVEDDMA